MTEHGSDVAPPIEAPQPDLAAGDEAEEEDQRRVLGWEATLGLHPATELLVKSLNHFVSGMKGSVPTLPVIASARCAMVRPSGTPSLSTISFQ